MRATMPTTDIPYRTLVIVRGTNPRATLDTLLTVVGEGFAAEVSLTTPDALGVIDRAVTMVEDASIGAGTVLTRADARRAVEAGAGFLVTPGVGPDLLAGPLAALPLFAGALTPSEIMAAREVNATAIKLFPASLGGPDYLRALTGPFPTTPFIPVGGVDLDQARQYLAAGAVAVGVGTPLVGTAADDGDLASLRARLTAWRAGIEDVVAR